MPTITEAHRFEDGTWSVAFTWCWNGSRYSGAKVVLPCAP